MRGWKTYGTHTRLCYFIYIYIQIFFFIHIIVCTTNVCVCARACVMEKKNRSLSDVTLINTNCATPAAATVYIIIIVIVYEHTLSLDVCENPRFSHSTVGYSKRGRLDIFCDPQKETCRPVFVYPRGGAGR